MISMNESIRVTVIGLLAGGLDAAATHPAITLKSLAQDGKSLRLGSFYFQGQTQQQKIDATLRLVRVLYRGLFPNVVSMSAITAVRMVVSDTVDKQLLKLQNISQGRRLNTFESMLGPFAGAATSAMLTGPRELGMTIIQTQHLDKKPPGFFQIYRKVVTQFGLWRVLTSGLVCISIRDGLVIAGFLSFVPWVKKHLKEKIGMNDIVASAVGGAFIGITTAVASHPADTIKTKQHANIGYQSDLIERLKNAKQCFAQSSKISYPTSITGVALDVYKESGLKGFYRGVLWRSLRVAPHVALIAAFTEKLDKVLPFKL